MRLPIDIVTPLAEPQRDTRTLAVDITDDLEWAYRIAREVIGHNHRRAESRYNERVVKNSSRLALSFAFGSTLTPRACLRN